VNDQPHSCSSVHKP